MLLTEREHYIADLVASIPAAPKDKARNLAFRAEIRALGDGSPDWADAINQKCSDDVIFFVDTFGWTLNPKDFPKEPRQPIVLFPMQEKYFLTLDWCVENGEPLLVEKSREQLISVGTAVYCLWRWMYRENSSIKIGSMKEELVDGDDFSVQIMPKIDYTLDALPYWMKPEGYAHCSPHRKHMTFKNPVSGRAIIGEATNKHFGVGGRFALLWLDEYPKIEDQDSIHRKVANTTNCFLYTGTPEGWERLATMINSGEYKVFRLHWTDNGLWLPKGYTFEECDWQNKKWPAEWICQPGCKAHENGGEPHSERYNFECKKLGWNAQDIAQELDINYLKAGASVFNQDKIKKAMDRLLEKPPEYTHYRLDFVIPECSKTAAGPDIEQWYFEAQEWKVVATPIGNGPLRILKGREPGSCTNKECKCGGTGYHTIVVGGDTARNLDKDWDCLYILDATLGDVIGEWHGRLAATKLGIEWAKICKWYGSSTLEQCPDAWAAIEWNELGVVVNETLMAMGVQIHISRTEDKIRNKRAPYPGIVIQPHNKVRLIQRYLVPQIDESDEDAPGYPRLYCPFFEFWGECQTYVYHASENLKTRPERAKPGAQTRKQHDDRVMAMLCTVYGAMDRFPEGIRGVNEYFETVSNMRAA